MRADAMDRRATCKIRVNGSRLGRTIKGIARNYNSLEQIDVARGREIGYVRSGGQVRRKEGRKEGRERKRKRKRKSEIGPVLCSPSVNALPRRSMDWP